MTSSSQAQLQIAEHRRAIDALDEQLVALLNERARHSLAIRALKPACGMQVFDPAREDQIKQRLHELGEGPLRAGDLDEIYGTILKVMKEVPSA